MPYVGCGPTVTKLRKLGMTTAGSYDGTDKPGWKQLKTISENNADVAGRLHKLPPCGESLTRARVVNPSEMFRLVTDEQQVMSLT